MYKPWLIDSFQALWIKQIYHVIIVFYLENTLKIFTHNPFLENYFIDIKEKKQPLYQDKIKNMNGYPLKVYNFDIVVKYGYIFREKNKKAIFNGFDGKYLSAVADDLNATLTIHNISSDFDKETVEKSDTDTPFMETVPIFRELFDLDIFGNVMRTYEDNLLDHVFLNERNDYLLVIPSGKMIPQYLYILLIVPNSVWIPTLFAISVVTILVRYTQKFYTEKFDWAKIMDDNFRLIVNGSIPQRSRGDVERFVLLLWMFFCLIFDTMYNSVLTSSLVTPQFYPDVENFEELYRSSIKVKIYH